MMFNSYRFLRILMALISLIATHSYAEESKGIKIIVPTAAEGSTDQLARILAAGMQERGYGRVEVVNMPGKSGAIAASFVANSKPDGSTLLIATPSSHSIAKALSVNADEQLPYDPVTSFSIISCFAKAPYIFVVGPNGPQSFDKFIDGARKSTSTLKYSSTGVGGPHHLIVEYLLDNVGLRLQHIPVAGGAKAIELVKSNEVQVMMPASILAVPQIQSGQIRALALTGDRRLTTLPTVPTFKELNVSLNLESWYGLMGPSGLSDRQIEELANVIQLVMQDPNTRGKIESLGINLVDIRDKDFARMIEMETMVWQKVSKQVVVIKK